MSCPPTLALLTDFGDADGFVGVVKGILSAKAYGVPILDVAHHIPAQNIRHGSWVLAQNFESFGPGSIFVAVVDPHVGSPGQKPVLLWWPKLQKAVVCPNNGLASRIIHPTQPLQAYWLNNPQYWGVPQAALSTTFHARDIYAPVAAHLARAMQEDTLEAFLDTVGSPLPLAELITLNLGKAIRTDKGWQGQADIIDTFGNVLTNLPAAMLAGLAGATGTLTLASGTHPITWQAHYTQGASGLVAVPGSHDMVELSLPCGHAAQHLGIEPGQAFTLSF